jgi:excisionase family DNA binding protein
MSQHGTSGYKGPPTLEPLLTVRSVCELLAVSRQTVYRIVEKGDMRPVRVGERLRFRRADIEAYLERNREPVASP